MPPVFLSNLLLLLPADGCDIRSSATQTSPWFLAIAIQEGRQGEEQHLLNSCSLCLVPISSARFCLEALAPGWEQPSSCALQLIPPGFRIAAVKRQFSVCCCVGGNSEQQERQSVCTRVPGCISLGLRFEGYFHSRKCWRLFIFFCLKFSRSWWYLPKRIYFWFLFILQWGDKAYASLQVWLLVCISLRMFLSVFPVRKRKSIN